MRISEMTAKGQTTNKPTMAEQAQGNEESKTLDSTEKNPKQDRKDTEDRVNKNDRRKDDRDRRDRDRRRSRSRDYRRRSRSGDRHKRDRDRRDRDYDRDRHRDHRDRDKDHRERRRSRSRSPVVEKTPEQLEAEKQAEEIEDLTKDQRTVFVSQLVMKADERGVKKFFEKIGKVKQVIMIRDKYTNRHKGFAYVEMANLDSIPNVLMLHNTVPDFQKFPMLIKASEAEKNFLAKQEIAASQTSSTKDRLYVGNLHELIGEDDLREVLKTFGNIDSVKITRDEKGMSRGYGFVKFSLEEDAATALSKLDQQGLELMGKVLKVGFVNDAPNGNAPGNWKLDDDEGKTGVTLDSNSRIALMQRLGGAVMAPGIPAMVPMMPMGTIPLPPPLPGVSLPGVSLLPTVPVLAPVQGTPSCIIKINNMFDPATETEAGWELDIKEDTEQECSKFGPVVFSYVESVQPGGIVYIVFSDNASAVKATGHLHGRWFAGRTITIEYMQPASFVAQFPEAVEAVTQAGGIQIK